MMLAEQPFLVGGAVWIPVRDGNLTALEREPHVRLDWTRQKLKDVARWANTWGWKDRPFEEYDRFYKRNARPERYDEQEGLFA